MPTFSEGRVEQHLTEASEEYGKGKGFVHPRHDPLILDFTLNGSESPFRKI